jgi:hypothetical protein
MNVLASIVNVLTQLFKVNLLISLIGLVVIVIFRTIIATVVDNSLIPVIERKGYSFSSNKVIYKKSSLMTFLFTILFGSIIGTAIAIAYVGILPKKESI